MKKIYIGILAVAFAGTASAQTVKQSTKHAVNKFNTISEVSAKATVNEVKGITLWSNDFSNPSQWVSANAGPNATPPHVGGSTPATSGNWTITTNASASPVQALNPAGFTTVANGYAIIDSDMGVPNNAYTQNATIVTAGMIDLSASPNVSMVFQQTHRRYAESTFVIVSNDNGATWTEFEVNGTMTSSTNSPNPQQVQVNISSAAGGQDSVKIGFKYIGAWDWFWAVDDVKITQTDDYDLSLNGMYWGTEGPWGARLPYYKMPVDQIAAVKFSGIAQNIGALAQNDVVFTATSGAFTGTSAQGSLAPNFIDTLDATTDLTPTTVGTYTFGGALTSGATDAAPTDNVITNGSFDVSNFVYQRDKGTYSSGSFNQGEGFEVGNIFDIVVDANIYSLNVFLHPNTNPGAEIFATVYDIDPATGDFIYAAGSASHIVTSAEVGTEIDLPLSSAFPVVAGTPYLVVVGSYGDGGTTDDLVVGTAGNSEAQTSYYYDMTNTTWYYTSSTPMVRIDFQDNASIEENAAAYELNMFPNPATESTTVSFNLKNNADVTVVVTDLAGKTVSSATVTNATAGKNKVDINTATMAAGVYTVNFVANNTMITKKLVVRK
jgi:hypothetical protein